MNKVNLVVKTLERYYLMFFGKCLDSKLIKAEEFKEECTETKFQQSR